MGSIKNVYIGQQAIIAVDEFGDSFVLVREEIKAVNSMETSFKCKWMKIEKPEDNK